VSGKVALSGKLICASADEARLIRQFLPEHVRLTRLEPGCLSFEVTETDDPLVWLVEELFADAAAFEAHQVRTKASEWARETAAIRRDYSIRTLES
jgi:Uncharacterized conserved protein